MSRNRWLARASAARSELLRYAGHDAAARELVRREWFFRISRHFTPVLAVDSGMGRLFVSTGDPHIGMDTFVHGSYDREAHAAVLSALGRHAPGWRQKEGVVVEVGANIGTTSLLLASYGPVIAFEPIAENVALLRQTVVANNLQDRITVRPIALSDHSGTLEMELSPDNSGDHRVRLTTAAGLQGERDRQTVHVRCGRLDDEITGDTARLVWIDAQGHEAHVLAGAPDLLASGVPVVMEYWPYGLRRAGGLDLLERLVGENFSTIVDTSRSDRDRARTLTAAALPELRARYSRLDGYTDLILLR